MSATTEPAAGRDPRTPDAAPSASGGIALVSMPWPLLGAPSIQTGTVAAVLARAGVPARVHSLHLEFMGFVTARQGGQRVGDAEGFSVLDYRAVADGQAHVGLGEGVFAEAARGADRARDERYLALLKQRGVPRGLVRKVKRLRGLVGPFLEHAADELLAAAPAAVGFTLTYQQVLPSLALARLLKARAPEVTLVLGGAGCEGPMGAALLRAFPFVDLAVRGESERVAPELFRALAAGEPVPAIPGVFRREGDEVVEGSGADSGGGPAERVPMDEVPLPDYDEFFERLARSPLAGEVVPEVAFESARGCWWGERSHCTFCGLNGSCMAFRSKSPERVLAELEALAGRHQALDFTAVDNIIDDSYFDSFVPALAQRGHDLRIFYETKANLSEERVRGLRDAGIRRIQPGIESLSTPLLKLMKKGVSGIQNVRLLRWCAQYDVHVDWNLLYGFPGEDPAEYAFMARLAPALVHLPAPRLGRLVIDRFSPYHVRPEAYGIRLTRPQEHYGLLYGREDDDPLLWDLAYAFDFQRLDGSDPLTYIGPLARAVERWRADEDRNRGALTYRRGPGFVQVTDRRTTMTAAQYVLEDLHLLVHERCEAGSDRTTQLAAAAERTGRPRDAALEAELDGVLAELCEAWLLHADRGRYQTLALPA
jgi:ribosomal peptide maturation radical SAM protein 1